jgi:signal transduction histidine kinase
MRVGQRLFLAVVPAILGLFTVAALAYWGQRYRSAPVWVVIAAAAAAAASLALAWGNTRYVARKIERLAGPGSRDRATRSALTLIREAALPRTGLAHDELDSIEEVVDRLSGAVAAAEAGGRQRAAVAGERVQEYAALLAEATSALGRQLDEVRLPIHILLESHFGTLNVNQEEMLAAARAATEAADIELRRLRAIADLDRGALSLRHELVRFGELLGALRPQLEADGKRTGIRLTLDIPPGLPRVAADRVRLQEAFELLLRHVVRHAIPGTAVTITATKEGGGIAIAVEGAPAPLLDPDVALARRIILAHGGSLEHQEGRTLITVPARATPGPEKSA